jgi:glycosyltransferase involved in cell wall biosynthesis
VQNREDREYFVERGIFLPEDVLLIRGSGVAMDAFCPVPEPDTEPVVVLASRMLREKGIEDFVAAARLLSSRGVKARFLLVGDTDIGNPHSLTAAELTSLTNDCVVEWLGHCSDMPSVFASCHIVCLPTYYGEGVPKVLIEAAAMGRPIVSTDTPGCRDIVRHNENGILVQPRDVAGLAHALERVICDKELRLRMGVAGRRLAEQEFSLTKVIGETLAVYKSFA